VAQLVQELRHNAQLAPVAISSTVALEPATAPVGRAPATAHLVFIQMDALELLKEIALHARRVPAATTIPAAGLVTQGIAAHHARAGAHPDIIALVAQGPVLVHA